MCNKPPVQTASSRCGLDLQAKMRHERHGVGDPRRGHNGDPQALPGVLLCQFQSGPDTENGSAHLFTLQACPDSKSFSERAALFGSFHSLESQADSRGMSRVPA